MCIRDSFLPLYSHAKWSFFHTSAKPSPPPTLSAPFSNAYQSPIGSASFGVATSSIRHRSMKCSCAAARSVRQLPAHLAANSEGVNWRWYILRPAQPGVSASRPRREGYPPINYSRVQAIFLTEPCCRRSQFEPTGKRTGRGHRDLSPSVLSSDKAASARLNVPHLIQSVDTSYAVVCNAP